MKMMPGQNSPLGSPFGMTNCWELLRHQFIFLFEKLNPISSSVTITTLRHTHTWLSCVLTSLKLLSIYFSPITRGQDIHGGTLRSFVRCESQKSSEESDATWSHVNTESSLLSSFPVMYSEKEEASAGGLALGPTHHSVKDAGINATALAWTWAVTQSGKAIAGKGLKMLRTERTISIGSAACWHEELGQCHALLVSSITELSTDEGECTSNHS